MASGPSRPELIVIVGPTASGKSELAIRIARQFNGEIISADSRSLYKGMDLGTAKPTGAEQKAIKHWGLDLLEPDQKFSAKEFKNFALAAIADIKGRHKLPILAGGTGLYVNSVIFDYDFPSGLESDPINPRHRLEDRTRILKLRPRTLIIGLDPGPAELQKRIEKRATRIMSPTFIKEAERLFKKHPATLEAFKAPAYRPAKQYLDGILDLEEARKEFVRNDLRLAKKQRTWFKRNKFILWHESINSAEHAIKSTLNT